MEGLSGLSRAEERSHLLCYVCVPSFIPGSTLRENLTVASGPL